jgi:hypothetical protein
MLLFLMRLVFRKPWLTNFAFIAAFMLLASGEARPWWLGTLGGLLFGFVTVFTLTRFGILPFMVAFMFQQIEGGFPLTLDFSRWYAGASLFAMGVAIGIAAFGFVTATRGRAILKSALDG